LYWQYCIDTESCPPPISAAKIKEKWGSWQEQRIWLWNESEIASRPSLPVILTIQYLMRKMNAVIGKPKEETAREKNVFVLV